MNLKKDSIYEISDDTFYGTIKNIKETEDKVSIELDSDEDLICNYYKSGKSDIPSALSLGVKVKISGTLKEPKNNTVPNTFNYRKYLNNRNIYYTCTIDEIEVVSDDINILYKIKNSIIDRIMTYKSKDYMLTLIIGDKSLLDENTYDQYKKNGVVHLFAISGMHIGLFSMIILKVLKSLKIKENPSYILTICILWVYAFLTGFSSSVLRSALLFSILSINKIFKLDLSRLRSLIYTGIILILIDYKIIFDIGFLFSWTTSFGLILESKFLSKHKIIGTSLVAFLYSAPITIQNFFKLNFASIIFNIIFVPLVSTIIYPLTLLSFLFKPIEALLIPSIDILEFINQTCSSIELLYLVIPKLSIIIIIIYYIVLILLFKNRPLLISILLMLSILTAKILPYLDSSSYVTILDVNQGDSALIRTPYSKEIILIDTGGIVSFNSSSNYQVSSNTITYLNSLGIDKIDTMILTHGDYDHMGEALNIIDNIEVKNVIFNSGDYNDLESNLIYELKSRGIDYKNGIDSLYDGKFIFLNTRDYDNENDNSLVTYFNLNDYKFLFMGDAGTKKENDILHKYSLSNIDFLKVGHHGSDTSSSKEFINSIEPKYSLISVGKNNRYGHPKKTVLDNLSDSKIYRTDIDGSLVLKLNKRGYKIETYSP